MAAPHSHPLDSPDNHSSLLNVVGWLLVVITFIIVGVRFGTRWAISRKFSLDDLLVFLALAFQAVQTGGLSLAVHHGLGDLRHVPSEQKLDLQEKSMYAFNLLFFLGQGFSMASVVVLIRGYTPVELHQRVATVILVAITIWIVVSLLGMALACKPSAVWDIDGGQCIDRVAFYTFLEAYNILLELALVVMPIMVTWNLQLRPSRKFMVIFCFFGRVFVALTIIAQLVVIYYTKKTQEPFLSWEFALTTIVAQSLGIISACVPLLRPFLGSLESGMIGNDDMRRRRSESHHAPSFLSPTSLISPMRAAVLAPGRMPSLRSDSIPVETWVSANKEHRASEDSGREPCRGTIKIHRTTTYSVSREFAELREKLNSV